MYYKISTLRQYQELKEQFALSIPGSVWNALAGRIEILNNYYGSDRDIEKDMGGYCVLFPPYQILDVKEYEGILDKYHLQQGEWEYREQIQDTNTIDTWIEELYLADNDYGIILFYPIAERMAGK